MTSEDARPSGRMRAVQTVVLIDAETELRAALADALGVAGYRVVAADTAEAGLAAAITARANVIVIDEAVGSPTGIDGASVIRRIRLDPALRDAACMLVTAANERAGELRALDAGADALLRRDQPVDEIVAKIAAVLRQVVQPAATDGPPPRVLAVDDDPEYLEPLTGLLTEAGYHVTAASSGEDALARLITGEFDCILLDLNMPGLGGRETCRRIKAAPMVRDVPLIMLTALQDREATIDVLSAGADDLIPKSERFGVLKARLRAHIRRKQMEDDNRRIREALLAAEIDAAETRAAREHAVVQAAMLDELARKNQELEAFAYSVSHDLRAPLRAILGFCRALVEDCGEQLDVDGRDHLQRVVTNAQRMNELIDDMLELSRVGRVDLRRASVDVSALAHAVVGELRRRDPARDVEVEIEAGLVIEADGKLIKIVLENLIGNAWKFTSKVAAARIEIARVLAPVPPPGAPGLPPGMTFCVKDNGAGFDPASAGRLFQPFRRLHNERDYEGTGIGLATVLRIVDRHGGRVWADARPGAGATFYVAIGRGRATTVIPTLRPPPAA